MFEIGPNLKEIILYAISGIVAIFFIWKYFKD